MADTLTLDLDKETAARLRLIAGETGESVEDVAQRLLGEAAAKTDAPYTSALTDEQLADLDHRLANPGAFATPEQVESFFARFKS